MPGWQAWVAIAVLAFLSAWRQDRKARARARRIRQDELIRQQARAEWARAELDQHGRHGR